MNSASTPLRKAAILVSLLDRESADALLRKMGTEQAARIRNAAMQLDDVPADEQQRVLSEFLRAGHPALKAAETGIEIDDSLAQKIRGTVMPAPRAPATDSSVGEPPPFRFLHEATADSLARHLQREHPQIVAVVVAHLPPKRAADLLKRLPESVQVDVLRRVAEMDAADPAILRDLEYELEGLLADEIRTQRNRTAGVAAVAAILTAAGAERSELLKNLANHDPQLISLLSAASAAPANSTRKPDVGGSEPKNARPVGELPTPRRPAPPPKRAPAERGPGNFAPAPGSFRFDDLARIDDHGLATLFKAAEPPVALLALTGASDQLVNRIARHLPSREARLLRRRLAQPGPLRLADIEQAQQRMEQLAVELADQGLLVLPFGNRFAAAA
jgi:flagellar motor switch protein FliG